MLESLPFVLIFSSILGFLSGIGVGGGSLLMIWLTVVLDMTHQTARGINLLFFLPAALIACLFRWKDGTLDKKTIVPAVISGCICAAVFSWISITMGMEILRKLFGGLLILTGLRELFWKQKKHRGDP